MKKLVWIVAKRPVKIDTARRLHEQPCWFWRFNSGSLGVARALKAGDSSTFGSAAAKLRGNVERFFHRLFRSGLPGGFSISTVSVAAFEASFLTGAATASISDFRDRRFFTGDVTTASSSAFSSISFFAAGLLRATGSSS